ncbi:enoyl-CoA hydratase-related protein [Marinibacterium sp. SX1]|uniref:enoyl-CoA hydratase-related protein n=1 Tax=Marinibacterium sp. SX1 TaxID=3388424 RepID=UPI003D17441C
MPTVTEPKKKAGTKVPAAAVPTEEQVLLVERRDDVAILTLNRPRNLNALNRQLAELVLEALKECDADPKIGAIVITGNPRAFAAGADIEEMANEQFCPFYMNDFLAPWDRVSDISKPIIAAVAGHALGGGCELALLCDFIIASDDAQFGQPEIKLGILPGIGGTQRLTRSVGKALAMDLVLTGRSISAEEARAAGLVARIVPKEQLLQTALEAAHTIAGYNQPAVKMAKAAVNAAFETPLSAGLKQERLFFQAAFATEGQKEGMAAFVAKRAPVFRNR